jgi:hypothetical protein
VIADARSTLTACGDWTCADVIRPGVGGRSRGTEEEREVDALRGTAAREPLDSTSQVATTREPRTASVIPSTRGERVTKSIARPSTGRASAGPGHVVTSDARELLTSVVRGLVDERVRDRIIAEARGNPLALLELP